MGLNTLYGHGWAFPCEGVIYSARGEVTALPALCLIVCPGTRWPSYSSQLELLLQSLPLDALFAFGALSWAALLSLQSQSPLGVASSLAALLYS